MQVEMFNGRILRALIFGAMCLVGLYLLFGTSSMLPLTVPVAACLVGIFGGQAIASSLVIFAAGLCWISGMLPKFDTHNIGRETQKLTARAVMSDKASANTSLSAKLAELQCACERCALTIDQCKTARDRILAFLDPSP